MSSSFEIRRGWAAVLLAAAVLATSCVYSGKSKTYASLLEKGTTREIQDRLAGTIRSNAEIIRELQQRPADGWLRFVVVGDTVSRRNGTYKGLLGSIAALDPPPAFVVNLGDFTRGAPEHFSFYFETIEGYPLPIIHVMGNHEDQYPPEMIFRAVFGTRDFFFDYGDVRFIFMGSEKLGFTRNRLEWLDDALKDAVPSKKIFVSHEFMLEAYREILHGIVLGFVTRIKGTDKVLELLDRYDVPLSVSGHMHRYYEKVRRGTVMIVTGGGGQPGFFEPRAKQPLSTKKAHFTIIDLPTGPGAALKVAITAMDRRGAPLFPTSFYRWGTDGDEGGPSMHPIPVEDLRNDATLPSYVRNLRDRSSRRDPLTSVDR